MAENISNMAENMAIYGHLYFLAHILANYGGKEAQIWRKNGGKYLKLLFFPKFIWTPFCLSSLFFYLRRYAGITVPYFRLWNVARCLLILLLSLRLSWHLLGCAPPVRYFRRLDRPVGIVPEIRE